MKWVIFLSLLLTASVASAKPLCLGEAKAPHRAIYLHGMDSEKPSPQEQGNRETLARIAKAMNMVIAVQRGNHRCKGQVCWRQDSMPEVVSTYKTLRSDAGACFDPDKGFGLIGFSNGGYFATKVAHFCLKPAPLWVAATGSAGSAPSGATLERCPRIVLQMGEKD